MASNNTEVLNPYVHAEKVHGVFRTIEQKFSKKFTDEENRVLEAIVRRDPDLVQRILNDIQASEDWYEEEFIKHPQIAAMIRELAIMGI